MLSTFAFAGNENSQLEKAINREMTYPSFAEQDQLEGVVYVSFTYNTNNEVEILAINYSSEEFAKYVACKLNNIEPTNDMIGKEFNYKINFTQQK